MPPQDGGASSNETIRSLEAEIAGLQKRQHEVEAKARRLLLEEDPAQGRLFAAEIHALRQERLTLQAEIDLRRARMNKLLLGHDAQDPPAR